MCPREVPRRLEGDDAGCKLGLSLDSRRAGQRPPALQRQRDAVAVCHERDALERLAPADVVDVDVREEDRVRPAAEPLELGGQPPLSLREELAAGRADAGVDEIVRPPPRIRYEPSGSRQKSPSKSSGWRSRQYTQSSSPASGKPSE
jgi:hypothetical protein